jgi:hypothetical protein
MLGRRRSRFRGRCSGYRTERHRSACPKPRGDFLSECCTRHVGRGANPRPGHEREYCSGRDRDYYPGRDSDFCSKREGNLCSKRKSNLGSGDSNTHSYADCDLCSNSASRCDR